MLFATRKCETCFLSFDRDDDLLRILVHFRVYTEFPLATFFVLRLHTPSNIRVHTWCECDFFEVICFFSEGGFMNTRCGVREYSYVLRASCYVKACSNVHFITLAYLRCYKGNILHEMRSFEQRKALSYAFREQLKWVHSTWVRMNSQSKYMFRVISVENKDEVHLVKVYWSYDWILVITLEKFLYIISQQGQ